MGVGTSERRKPVLDPEGWESIEVRLQGQEWGRGGDSEDRPAQVWRWERGTEQSPVCLPGESEVR